MTASYDDIPREADERATLTAFLDWQRATLMRKCEGLSDEQLRERAVPPSTLSLLGLVRHMADVERWWFRINLTGEPVDQRYSTDEDEDGDFDNLDADDVATVLAHWQAECERARSIVASHSLEDKGKNRDTGRVMSLRWTLLHMIEEYSRHNGHADLLRQRIDGAVGY
ncbi:MAG: Mini-circle protein [Candidatus Aeolococcus gillhamiae]|uniref:Mini-circle protein n=1 Tax=Candidatus Aeolococcus gillhamiae TaxID=3127015 RepID=A0A2W5ZAW6_9BACT|nr:MAG: Mini-circle protein [Candidatus Dormibacter sp. RRmetagenome_bin12]